MSGYCPRRAARAGYRQYGERDLRTLQFIRRSRDLGFSIEEIRGLVSLWQGRTRPSREVRALAKQHLDFLDRKLEELQSIDMPWPPRQLSWRRAAELPNSGRPCRKGKLRWLLAIATLNGEEWSGGE